MAASDSLAALLPRGGYSTPASAVDFAAILLLGPAWTAWLVLTSSLVTHLLVQRRPPVRAFYNAALFAVMVAASGEVYRALGGAPGAVRLPEALLPTAAAAATYFLANAAGVSAVLSATGGGAFRQVFWGNYIPSFWQHASNLAVGATAAFLYLSLGPWGLVVFLLPVITAGFGFRRYFQMKRDLLAFVRALVQVLDEVDPYTREHSLRVAEYAKAVARELRLPGREIDDVEYGALLHDLGKIGRQYQEILRKPGPLDGREREAVRAHPDRGADIVARVRALSRAAELVRCHHERIDARGYPRGVPALELPLGARIVTVCDAFDAMTSDRSYRRARSAEEALAELVRCAGEQFDPRVVATLARLHEAGRLPALARDAEGGEPEIPVERARA
jgi:putative nucleotidyltransferase with HDIG domain